MFSGLYPSLLIDASFLWPLATDKESFKAAAQSSEDFVAIPAPKD